MFDVHKTPVRLLPLALDPATVCSQGATSVRDRYRFIKPEKITRPKLLKRNTDNTGMVGKWPAGFDDFKGNGGEAKQTMTGAGK